MFFPVGIFDGARVGKGARKPRYWRAIIDTIVDWFDTPRAAIFEGLVDVILHQQAINRDDRESGTQPVGRRRQKEQGDRCRSLVASLAVSSDEIAAQVFVGIEVGVDVVVETLLFEDFRFRFLRGDTTTAFI